MKAKIKYYGLLFALMILTSCSTVAILKVSELKDGIGAGQLYHIEELIKPTGDADYALITQEWWDNELLPYMQKEAFKDKLEYKNSFDCNRFADWAYVHARLFYAKSPSKYQAPAFGYMEYKTDMGPWHAINFMIMNDGRAVFIEPQFLNRSLATQSPKDVKVSVGNKSFPMTKIYPRSTLANPIVELSATEVASIRQYRL